MRKSLSFLMRNLISKQIKAVPMKRPSILFRFSTNEDDSHDDFKKKSNISPSEKNEEDLHSKIDGVSF